MPPAKASNIPSTLTSKFQLFNPRNAKPKNVNSSNSSRQSAQGPKSNKENNSAPKRIKACLRCRKSKVKCENNGEGPCKRCFNGQFECIYQMKVHSYSSKEIKPVNHDPNQPPMSSNGNRRQYFVNNANKFVKNNSQYHQTVSLQQQQDPQQFQTPSGIQKNNIINDPWKNSMENKLENFNDTLNEIMGFLKDGKFNDKLPNPQLDSAGLDQSIPSFTSALTYQQTNNPISSSFSQSSYNYQDSAHSKPSFSAKQTPYVPSNIYSNAESISDYHDTNLSHPTTEKTQSFSYPETYQSGTANPSPWNYSEYHDYGYNPITGGQSSFQRPKLPSFNEVLGKDEIGIVSANNSEDQHVSIHKKSNWEGYSNNQVNINDDADYISNEQKINKRPIESISGASPSAHLPREYHCLKRLKHTMVSGESGENSLNLDSQSKSNTQKTSQNLYSLVPYSMFQELYSKFLDNAAPHLFGFDVSKFDKRLIYVKSKLMVIIISLIGCINNPKFKQATFIDSLRKLYLETVNDVIFKSNSTSNNKSGSAWGIDDVDDEINENGNKLLNGVSESVSDSQREYDDYISLCSHDTNDSETFPCKKWDLLTNNEKDAEIKNSREFKLFMNITALCIGTFWFENSQLLLGIALQLASEFQLNKVFIKLNDSKIVTIDKSKIADEFVESGNKISEISKLKLWYLLYIADTQQSFLSGKQPIMNSSQDRSLKQSRKLLFQHRTNLTNHSFINSSEIQSTNMLIQTTTDNDLLSSNGEVRASTTKKTLNENLLSSSATYNDLKLVSQLEFNQAINAVVSGNAWGILSPDLFGMPWKTNLELDKWMVHWTCLLTPIHQTGNPWSVKSTLIYYNFARLHVNHQHGNLGGNNTKSVIEPNHQIEDEDNSDLIYDGIDHSHDLGSKDIAVSSAQSLIKSAISDRDIVDNLRYSPLHIYVMLYYSALALLDSGNEMFSDTHSPKPPNMSSGEYGRFKEKSQLHFENLVLVRSLVNVLSDNLPLDKEFGLKLIRNLKKKLEKKYAIFTKVGQKYGDSANKVGETDDRNEKIRLLDEMNEEEINRLLGTSNDDKKGQILAWPGTNHQHP
ncbi:hypothetical protein DASC09_015830 [Saccharomycopsis crataegensis]|uniref:Zn(2)-C6 fungal-type domain-containing protein n=1 Tax=Saccharomycopsis crataegensis TaxID=43959 RepID=A0AAV5QJE6_9ASCO|nr:hypothetical protein DASC09_015830 [Saccharomycopsis crataegensis]